MNKKNTVKELLILDLKRYNKNFEVNSTPFIFIILKKLFTNPSFRSLYFYRIMNHQFSKKGKISIITLFFNYIFNKMNIPYSVKIGGGLFIPHAECIIINENCIIGNNVTILQGVTLGGNVFKEKNGRRSPTIGNDVLIGAGAKILGPVSIGDNSMIGANAVVVKDIPENSVAVGIPAKVIKKAEKSFIELEMEFNESNRKFE